MLIIIMIKFDLVFIKLNSDFIQLNFDSIILNFGFYLFFSIKKSSNRIYVREEKQIIAYNEFLSFFINRIYANSQIKSSHITRSACTLLYFTLLYSCSSLTYLKYFDLHIFLHFTYSQVKFCPLILTSFFLGI